MLRLCLEHPGHAPFLVGKLWEFFVTEPLPAATRARLAASYVASGLQLRPLVRSILAHPALYANLDADEMVKWPAVYVAGQLRTMGASVKVSDWNVLMASMGQTPVLAALGGRLGLGDALAFLERDAGALRRGQRVDAPGRSANPGNVRVGLTPDEHLELALRRWAGRRSPRARDAVLRRFVAGYGPRPGIGRSEQLQRALRHLLISGPDNQLC